MIRKDFLTTLELVAPGLAPDNLVPIFQNYCFKAGTVYAFRGDFGVVAPCQLEKEFAVHGKTLIELIRASSAKELDITLEKDNALLRAGKSKIKLPYFASADFLFEEPEKEKWDIMVDVDKTFLHGLELCLVTTSNDYTQPALMGVTILGGNNVFLYSCDGDAISRYQIDAWKTKKVQYTIPNAFCEAILKIAEKTGFSAGQLYVNKDWAVLELANNYRVFGRIIDNPEPIDYEAEMARVVKATPEFVEIPSALAQALNRARIIGEAENKSTDIKIDGRKLFLSTDTHMGVVKDTIALKGDHPSLEVKVNAKLMSRAIGITDEFGVQEYCTTYRHGEDFLLVMANIAE